MPFQIELPPPAPVSGAHRRIARISRTLGVFIAALASIITAAAQTTPVPTVPRTISVGVLTDNHPFSFVAKEGGAPQGFVVDLLAAIEKNMSLRLDRNIGSTAVINGAFRDGRLDMVQSYAQATERETYADFSVPYLSMAGSIFARKTDRAIRTLADLRGRKVMVHAGSLGEQLLRNAGLADSIVHVESIEHALRLLEEGTNDATLVSRLSGLAAAHHLGLKKVGPVGDPIDGYTVRYCFAVRDGDRRLLAQLNEGLAILQRTGEFERIYRKWFGHFDHPGYTQQQIVAAIVAGLALALAVALWAMLRQRTLRRRIARQAGELRASEVRYRGVFESSPEALLVLHPLPGAGREFGVEQANPAALRLFGLAAHPPLHTPLRSLLPDETSLCDRLVEGLAPAGAAAFEYERGSAAKPGWLRVSVSRIGENVLAVIADITEAKSAEALLRRQEQQIRQTQKLEAIGTLASGVAHDFNNLLTSIVGNADLATLDLAPDHPAARPLDEIRAASDRAGKLVRQILTFSRQAEPRRETLSIAPLVEETLGFLRATAARESLQIRHRIAEATPEIEGDETQLQQVLMNLCTNAVHAMRGTPGILEVVVEPVAIDPELAALHPPLVAGEHVGITVRDTGTGMPPEVLQRIFEPFFTTKAPGEGTGLGLSVVHGIVQSHGGAITAYSKPGHGTIFHLYFPVARARRSTSTSKHTGAEPRGHGELILFVDDEAAIARLATQLLVRVGYTVSVHTDPVQALAEFEAKPERFSAVITDLTMPKLNGLEFAARIRVRKANMPVVLMSGYLGEVEIDRAQALGIAHVVEKPLTLSSLSRAVSGCLAKDRGPTKT